MMGGFGGGGGSGQGLGMLTGLLGMFGGGGQQEQKPKPRILGRGGGMQQPGGPYPDMSDPANWSQGVDLAGLASGSGMQPGQLQDAQPEQGPDFWSEFGEIMRAGGGASLADATDALVEGTRGSHERFIQGPSLYRGPVRTMTNPGTEYLSALGAAFRGI